MNLPEEFTLIAYDDDGKPVTDGMHVENGLGGALLLELALTEKVDVVDKKVVVLDPKPTGDPLVDDALARIAGDKPRSAKSWVTKLRKGARDRVLDQLVTKEVLRREPGKVLLVFPRTKYPSTHGVEPPQETDARQRMLAAVAGSGPVEPRTAALCSLIAATDLDKKVFADLDRKLVKARLKEIGQGAWAATAVKKAIEEVQAAIIAAVVSSSAAANSGGSQ